MGDRTIINYNLVAQSSKNINKSASELRTTSGVNGDLPNLITQIINEGKNHDDCLSSFEGELDQVVSDVDNSIIKMEELSAFCMVAFNAFLDAEANIKDGIATITINGTDFPNVKIESSGMKEYVNSMLDSDDLAGSTNPNTLSGPLTEEEWQRYELIFTKAMNEATSKKEKAAIAAIFMTSVYPHMPYDWGGGHYAGDLTGEDSINKELGETYNGLHCNFQEDHRLRTFDCSGFTSWVLKEAGFSENTWSYVDSGNVYANNADLIVSNSNHDSIQQFGENYNPDNCSIGDIAYMHNEEQVGDFNDDHIGVVVAKEGDIITVAHISGGSAPHDLQAESAGMGYTKINTKTGEVLDDSTTSKEDRIGKVYFTHTASME